MNSRFFNNFFAGGGTDTSDATATAEDIRAGKTAYVAKGKITGTAESLIKKLIEGSKSDGSSGYVTLFYKSTINLESLVGILEYDDTSDIEDFSFMFNGKTTIQEIPKLNTKKATHTFDMFYNCTSLKHVPEMETSLAVEMGQMFYNCTSLETVELIDMNSVKTTDQYGSMDMFRNCANLKNLKIKNLGVSLKIGSGTDYGHLLTVESLLYILGHSKSNYKILTIGTANIEKLKNTYVLPNDYIDPIICEPDEPGAMTGLEFAKSKSCSVQ